jgi:hypothetical protein
MEFHLKFGFKPVAQFPKFDKYLRDASACSASGGIVIKPSIDKRGSARRRFHILAQFIRLKSNLLPSPATLTSSKTRGCIPSLLRDAVMSLTQADLVDAVNRSKSGHAGVLFF